MNFLFIIFKIIFLILILPNNSFAKGLPPGTGEGDIPANVLILLDKSGSMDDSEPPEGMKNGPRSIAVDSSTGDYYVWKTDNTITKFSFLTMEKDDSWASGSYSGTGECQANDVKELRIHGNKLYVAAKGAARVFRLDLTTEICDWNAGAADVMSLDIKGDYLYSFGSDINVFDLSSSTPQEIVCSYSNDTDLKTQGLISEVLAIDSSIQNLYFHKSSTFYRFEIDQGTKCPSETKAAEFTSTNLSTAYSMIFAEDSDRILLVPDYHDEFIKYELNEALDGITSTQTKGSYTGSDVSTVNNLYVDYPRGIDLDTTNDRIIFISGGGKSVAHVLQYNLDFIKESLMGPMRIDGAFEAIKALVTDSSLTSHVDFGYGYWSSGGGNFTNWTPSAPPEEMLPMEDEEVAEYGITYGTASPCNDSNCLKVRVHRQGAPRIDEIVADITPGGGTSAMSFTLMLQNYYLHPTFTPIDDTLDCQDSYAIVIGDGSFGSSHEVTLAIGALSALATRTQPIKTFMVAYGGDITGSALDNFNDLAAAGGTEEVIIADTPEQLKTQLRAKITQIIADKLAFTAPSVPLDVSTGGSLYQSSFHYKQNAEWTGELIRTAVDSDGNINTADSGNWSAKAKMPNPDSRKIWTTLKEKDYSTDYNNFVTTNSGDISNLFNIFSYAIVDYHSDTSIPIGTRRCASTTGVDDGIADDLLGLIKFVRGEDYFDYDADCILSEKRTDKLTGENIYLGDIYHSELIVVGPPNASTSFTGTNQESYWRYLKGYDVWSETLVNRKKMIYVGANDGMLHAFNATSGVEEWAFVPPFIAAKLPIIMNQALNDDTAGGSNAIYGVDGSPTVHDMWFTSPLDTADAWHTILIIPYGRGGSGFSILDITDPDAPLHLFSVYNDVVNHKVHVINEQSVHSNYSYVANSYNISAFKQAKQVKGNFDRGDGAALCDATGNNQCYESTTWTLPLNPQVPNLVKENFAITKNGINYQNFIVAYDSAGDLVFTFNESMRYAAFDNPEPPTSQLGIRIISGANTGVQTPTDYDYSKLGESWSSPRIIRLPKAAGDNNIHDDKYVAIMGGGFGTQNLGVGSNLFIINLQDTSDGRYGKVHKIIDIQDLQSNNIVNSTPGLPVVITPDTTSGISYRGALVYLNDLEGKITKINLTDMVKDNLGNKISLYDSTTLFTAGATTSNGRFMYHSMEAGIGQATGNLWLFTGTGDYERLTEKSSSIQNLLLGIKDKYFPYYKEINTALTAQDLTNCKNTTPSSATTVECPGETDLGWYITLSNSEKVSAEPTIAKGTVYFPIYRPSETINRCSMGAALICAIDDECGTPVNDKIGATQSTDCRLVGQGVLSKIIVFADKIFANIAGEGSSDATQGSKSDLISLGAAAGDVETYRTSWRENY